MTWTPADTAELDCLIWELVDETFTHRESCPACRAWQARETGATPCPHIGEAIDIVLRWRQRRQLLSRAEQLRAEQRRIAA